MGKMGVRFNMALMYACFGVKTWCEKLPVICEVICKNMVVKFGE